MRTAEMSIVRETALSSRVVVRALLLASTLPLLVACSETPATQTMVRFAAVDDMESRGASLTVRIFRPDGEVAYDETRSVDDMPALGFPATVPVTPESGDASVTFSVEATLRDAAGSAIGGQTARSGFVGGELREIWLCFDGRCEGVTCGGGQRCVAGTCENDALEALRLGDVTPAEACPGAVGDAGPDADADVDAGPDAPACTCSCASDACVDGACVPRQFTSVAAGTNHACAIDEAGGLFCWGTNAAGQLGVGDTTPRREPTAVTTSTTVVQVAAGDVHTCAVLGDGSLACWGSDDDGRAGQLATDVDLLVPTAVGTELDWAQVDAGERHTCGLRSTGVYCWGSNGDGRLGINAGTGGERQEPAEVRGNFIFVATGGRHTCAIEDGSWHLHCWGEYSAGRLAEHSLDITMDQPTPFRSPSNRDFLMLSLGLNHSMSVGRDGMLRGWGSNRNRQVGLESWEEPPHAVEITTDTDWSWVSAGGNHSCAIQSTPGVLVCFGTGDQGQLARGDTSSGHERMPVGDPGWTRVAAGGAFSCGIRDDGTLHCWGDNAFGQLGVGDVMQRLVPERVCHPGTP